MTAPRKDLAITPEKVREEHLAEVHVPIQWLYLGGLLLGGFIAMLAFMAWLAGTVT